MRFLRFNARRREDALPPVIVREPAKPQEASARERGDAARDARNWRLATALYREHLALSPGDFAIWVQRGHAEKEIGAFAEAEACYRAALALTPNDADLWLQIGHLKKLTLRFAEAAEAYRNSLALDPEGRDAQEELARLDFLFSSLSAKAAPIAAPEPEAIEPAQPPLQQPSTPTLAAAALSDGAALGEAVAAAVERSDFLLAAAYERARVRNAPLDPQLWRALEDLFERLGRAREARACEAAARLIEAGGAGLARGA